jgi:hypothetical protein
MAFSTKLRLSDAKFEQQSGDTLTLAGATIIGSGGTLRYGEVPSLDNPLDVATVAFVTGNTETATGSTVYNLSSPTTVEVGGLSSGTVITGLTSNEIIEQIVAPVLTPTFTAPSVSFSDNITPTQEVGDSINITFTASFDRGEIELDGSFQDFRSGPANTYNYTGTGLPATVASTANSDVQNLNGYTVLEGSNQFTASVSYDQGPQPLDSSGSNFGSPLAAGTTSTDSVSHTGIFPYFFGTVASGGAPAGSNRPTINNDLVTGGTKVVASANGTVTVNFNSSSDDYIFLAVPASTPLKVTRFNSALDFDTIGGPVGGGSVFPDPVTISVNSPDGFWSGESFEVYLSNRQQEFDTPTEFRES